MSASLSASVLPLLQDPLAGQDNGCLYLHFISCSPECRNIPYASRALPVGRRGNLPFAKRQGVHGIQLRAMAPVRIAATLRIGCLRGIADYWRAIENRVEIFDRDAFPHEFHHGLAAKAKGWRHVAHLGGRQRQAGMEKGQM